MRWDDIPWDGITGRVITPEGIRIELLKPIPAMPYWDIYLMVSRNDDHKVFERAWHYLDELQARCIFHALTHGGYDALG
jgi:hypothetical protein